MPRLVRELVEIAGIPAAEFVDILVWDLVHATGGAEPIVRSFVGFRLRQCMEEIEAARDVARKSRLRVKALEKRCASLRHELTVERATLKAIREDYHGLRESVEEKLPASQEVQDGRRGLDGRYQSPS